LFIPIATFDSLELNSAIGEVMQSYNGVAKWAKPESPPFTIVFAAMKPLIRKEPKGTVLIISPFNLPVWLTISPLVRISTVKLPPNSQQLMSICAGRRNCCGQYGSTKTL
jgi:acyl-CoA reductase-like NAD-dependent aldehyde dehydrogenase